MAIHPDFRELLGLFLEAEVRYAIVGGYALAFHGAPRFTGDIDLLVQPSAENALRVVGCLDAFGFASLGIDPSDFEQPGRVLQLGYPPSRVDLITSITGVGWEEVEAGRVRSDYGGVEVWYLGREELIRNKRATGRAKDLADLEALGER
jgi:hypothetical protein